MGHSWILFLVLVQGGVAQPADGSSTGLSQLLLLSSSLLLSYSHLDHLSRLCFDQRSIGIRQPYPLGQAKTVLHPNRRGKREPLQNPKLVVLHINEATMCTTHSRPPGQACRSPPIHPSKPPGLPVGVHIGGGQHTFARKYKTKRAHRNLYKMHNLYYRYW